MTVDASEPTRPQRLAIVHLLGWTLGVAAVLGIYRAAAVWHASLDNRPVQMTWPALGYGLAYGTAVSGLGLFIWRWWRGASQGPTQPGHWLLVFAGIGLLIDLGVALAIEVAQVWLDPSRQYVYLAYPAHQAVGWAVGAVLGMIVLLNLRGAGRLWIAATLIVVLMMSANSLACAVSFIAAYHGFPGTWIWWVPVCVRVSGEACVVVIVAGAEISDRWSRLERDWLHLGGIVAALALGAVDLSLYAPWLWR